MKHILLSFILTGLLKTDAFAQIQTYVRGGVGMSRATGQTTSMRNVIGIPVFSQDRKAQLAQLVGNELIFVGNIGLGLSMPLTQRWLVQAELNVEQKGSRLNSAPAPYMGMQCVILEDEVNPVQGEFSSRATYLTLPVLVGYRFGKLALLTGPYVGYVISERMRGSYTGLNGVNSEAINTTGLAYKSVDWGIAVGLTYPVTPLVTVDLRYSQGLTAIASPSTYLINRTSYTRTDPSRHQTAQLSVRYNLLR